MSSIWTRKSRLISAPAHHAWWAASTQCPVVHKIRPDLWRIFFGARDYDNRTRTIYADANPKNGMEIIHLNDQPVVTPRVGDYPDSDGIFISCFSQASQSLHAYTIEIHRCNDTQFSGTTGLLETHDDGLSFSRPTDEAILGGDYKSPDYYIAPCVLKRSDGWHVWFARMVRWDLSVKPAPEYYYEIWHARSEDGLRWTISPNAALPLQEGECGITRPWVQERPDGLLEMWYCRRGTYDTQNPKARHYTLGYALSEDGLTWQRREDLHRFTNPPQPGDWDHEMQCYASVVADENGQEFMFYSGNDYGRASFGYAVRDA